MLVMSDSLSYFRSVLLEEGLIQGSSAILTPLCGGVSSDICKVEEGDRIFVVKRALAKLKVADDWFADVSRNRFELAYLRRVDSFLPGAVPGVIHAAPDQGWFAMEYLDGFENWKAALLQGTLRSGDAAAAGRILGTIHRTTWDDGDVRAEFETTEQFHQLRIEPYLLTTADRCRDPELAAAIRVEATRLRATRRCLVHGDFSPKNLLISCDRLVVLDCEVAWFGDPCFDVAFLLNHLLLKALHLTDRSVDFVGLASTAWASYQRALGDPDRIALVAVPLLTLLPMLMLARIDGKSPVEYLTREAKRQAVREFAAGAILGQKAQDPEAFFIDWLRHLRDSSALA